MFKTYQKSKLSDASSSKNHLKLVVCDEWGIDDTQKVFGFFACAKPVALDLNYMGSSCQSRNCEGHICAPVVLKHGGSNRITKDQKTLWFIFYHDWNMGDLFDPDYHPVCGAYVTKEEALKALRLPSHVIPPGNQGGTESPVAPHEIEDFGVNGEFYCREYPVRGWQETQAEHIRIPG